MFPMMKAGLGFCKEVSRVTVDGHEVMASNKPA